MKKYKCGCEKMIISPDKKGRDRLYSKGHNPKPWLTGRKVSRESIQKMSNARKRYYAMPGNREKVTGENNPNWKKDKSRHFGIEYISWRTAVYKRDGYTCQECGQRGGRLNADHIKPWAAFPELRYVIENGRTLCEKRHQKTETFGWGTYWINFRAAQLKKGIDSML